MEKKESIKLKFLNLVLNKNQELEPDIGCYIQVNSQIKQETQRFIEVVILQEQNNEASLKIEDDNDILQLIVKKMSTNEVIGSVSICIQQFLMSSHKQFQQWFTLFDDVYDDEFDGEIGEDDEETPKVLFNFEIQGQYNTLITLEPSDQSHSIQYSDSQTQFCNVTQQNVIKFDQNLNNEEILFDDTSQLQEEENSLLNQIKEKVSVYSDIGSIKQLQKKAQSIQRNSNKSNNINEMIKKFDGGIQKNLMKSTDLELRELDKMNEFVYKNQEQRNQINNHQKNYDNLMNQYNNCITQYQGQFKELNDENLKLKTELAQTVKESKLENEKLKKKIKEQQYKNPTSNIEEQSSEEIQMKYDNQLRVLNDLLKESHNDYVTLELKFKNNEDQLADFSQQIANSSDLLTQKENTIKKLEKQLMKIEEDYQNMNDSQTEIQEKHQNELSACQHNLRIMTNKMMSLQKNYDVQVDHMSQEILNNFNNEINQFQDQINSQNDLIEDKNKQINELIYQIKNLKAIQATQDEKFKILENYPVLLKDLKEDLTNMEMEKDRLHKDLYDVSQDLLKMTSENIGYSKLIFQMSQEIKRLEEQIQQFSKSPKSQYSSMKGDKIDEALGEYLKLNQVPVKFTRIEEGMYIFGSKRVIITLQKQQLQCRVGGGFQQINDFLKNYTLQELQKMKQTGNFSQLAFPVPLLNKSNSEEIQEEITNNREYLKEICLNKMPQNVRGNSSKNRNKNSNKKVQQSESLSPFKTINNLKQNFTTASKQNLNYHN